MAFIGMDIEAVRQLATQMDNKASDIDNIMSTLNNLLNNTEWVGTDATNFRNDWSSTHMTNLRNVSNALKNAATAARTNASEQEQASGR
ncbi:MAG: hypothetical protein QM286_07960 [Acidobacteriota bacterium]|nr:hypothetical protein [Acidobacteriota bacterium]